MWLADPITWMLLVFATSATEPTFPTVVPAACLMEMTEIGRWPLPNVLREASGLHATDDHQVWVHGDERGELVLVSTRDGSTLAQTKLGDRTIRGDFEGVTVMDNVLYLMTSDGDLFRAQLPVDGQLPETLPVERARTDLRGKCELEGLETDASPGVLLLACKTPYKDDLKGTATIFRWDVEAGKRALPQGLVIESSALGEKQFRTSALARDRVSGQLLLISSIDNKLAVLAPDGSVIGFRKLGKRHRQPEGVAWQPPDVLAIVDEGGTGPALLTVYRCGN